jgi:hypothetical protein
MIPDDPIIFNHYGAFSHLDDHEAHLRHLPWQNAIPTLEGGRQLLSVCEEMCT